MVEVLRNWSIDCVSDAFKAFWSAGSRLKVIRSSLRPFNVWLRSGIEGLLAAKSHIFSISEFLICEQVSIELIEEAMFDCVPELLCDDVEVLEHEKYELIC